VSVLKPNQRKAIEQLLIHGEIQTAAVAAGVSRDSIHRWLKEPVFVAALREAERLAIGTAARSLARLATKATGILETAMDDHTAPPSTRIRAADLVLTRLIQLREFTDLEERLTALEENAGRERVA
jgi:hypothetical protein